MRITSLLLMLILNTYFSYGQSLSTRHKLNLNDPCLFAGSTLPNVFQRLWINGDYATMLKFTSAQSRSKFGDARILEYFQNMNFGYTLKLKSRYFEKDGTQTLNCLSIIDATRRVIRFKCLVENDTAKIIISDVEKVPFP